MDGGVEWGVGVGGFCMRPEKGYASVCGCTVCLRMYVEGGDKFSSGSGL